LTSAPLFRAAAAHVAGEGARILFVIHHIIADEWAMEVVQRELRQLYQAFSHGRPNPLAPLPIQYADYAIWQRERLDDALVDGQLRYWKQELAGAPTVLELATDKPRPAVQSYRGSTEHFSLPKRLYEDLKALARRERSTLFMVLQAGFAALLHRYCGQEDLLVGTPISGRRMGETEDLIGCFLNTIVMRANFAGDPNFRALLHQVRERALGAYAHADLPFKQLVAAMAPERDVSRSPLFQAMFILHDVNGLSEVSKVSGKNLLETGTSKFDLSLLMSESGEGLDGVLEYSTDLFEASTMRRMGSHLVTLLEAAVADPEQSISGLEMLTAGERRQLLEEWNDSAVRYDGQDLCLHQLIERQAERTPQQTALVFDGQSLSYGELNQRAGQLAEYLRGLNVGPDVFVGIALERSLEMVIGILAVLKAGGAYLPLDPSFPENRLAYMVEDSRMPVMLTHRGIEEKLPVLPPVVVRLDADAEKIAAAGRTGAAAATEVARPALRPENLAYLLYTSGSTGKPKGVAIPHAGIVNFLLSMQQEPGLGPADTMLAVTTLSFDIAGLELYLPLLCGGKVVIASREDAQDPRRLARRIAESACTVMQATPATWRALLDTGWQGSPQLKALCGGEALLPDLARELLSRCGELWNMYGPTETTVWSTVHKVSSVEGVVPIGRPIANTQVYVLDARRSLVPPGSVGELYIGGDGLARGYWQRDF